MDKPKKKVSSVADEVISITVPRKAIAGLKCASFSQLKTLIYICIKQGSYEDEQICSECGITQEELQDALQYWKNKEVLTVCEGEDEKPREMYEPEVDLSADRAAGERQLRIMFNIGNDKLTKQQTAFLDRWFDEKPCSLSLVGLAYEYTLMSINQPNISYTNAILNNWYEKGLNTPEKVKKSITSESYENRGKTPEQIEKDKMYEDWFEIALKRSMDSME